MVLLKHSRNVRLSTLVCLLLEHIFFLHVSCFFFTLFRPAFVKLALFPYLQLFYLTRLLSVLCLALVGHPLLKMCRRVTNSLRFTVQYYINALLHRDQACVMLRKSSNISPRWATATHPARGCLRPPCSCHFPNKSRAQQSIHSNRRL